MYSRVYFRILVIVTNFKRGQPHIKYRESELTKGGKSTPRGEGGALPAPPRNKLCTVYITSIMHKGDWCQQNSKPCQWCLDQPWHQARPPLSLAHPSQQRALNHWVHPMHGYMHMSWYTIRHWSAGKDNYGIVCTLLRQYTMSCTWSCASGLAPDLINMTTIGRNPLQQATSNAVLPSWNTYKKLYSQKNWRELNLAVGS